MGNKIKELRQAKGMNQSDLARRIGTTPSTISRLEDNKRRLTEAFMIDIAKALGVAPGDLLGSSETRKDIPQSFVPIVGECSLESWKVASGDVNREWIPVSPATSVAKYAHTAYRVADNHARELIAADGYVATIPLKSLRREPLDGDWIVVRTTEGRMERHVVVRARNDAIGPLFEIGGETVRLGVDEPHAVAGLVVAVYRALI